jgi:hypothetical protein
VIDGPNPHQGDAYHHPSGARAAIIPVSIRLFDLNQCHRPSRLSFIAVEMITANVNRLPPVLNWCQPRQNDEATLPRVDVEQIEECSRPVPPSGAARARKGFMVPLYGLFGYHRQMLATIWGIGGPVIWRNSLQYEY